MQVLLGLLALGVIIASTLGVPALLSVRMWRLFRAILNRDFLSTRVAIRDLLILLALSACAAVAFFLVVTGR